MPVPKHLENVLRLLLPPASREHVLGDLHERYKSPKSYLRDALSVLGPVIISRIRRTTDVQLFLIEILTIYLSFTATAWYFGEQNVLYGVLPAIVAGVALLICNAYSDPQRKSVSKPILETTGSLALAFLGQAVVFDTQESLAVPFPIMVYGSVWAVLLVSTLRVLFPPAQSRWPPLR